MLYMYVESLFCGVDLGVYSSWPSILLVRGRLLCCVCGVPVSLPLGAMGLNAICVCSTGVMLTL